MGFKVVITGASGVLGSAILKAFERRSDDSEILALAYSNPDPRYTRVDLSNAAEASNIIGNFKPDWVIHCAAERRPDVAEKDPEGTRKLNAEVPAHLAQLSKIHKFVLIYISTDYVFDGTSPPYTPQAKTNPLQLYGRTKRDGEIAVLSVSGATVIVLRVPVLYGPSRKNSDSAINILLDVVQDQSGKQYKIDHYATRYPTNVDDIASFLSRLSDFNKPIPPILHYSAPEPYTKYEICLVFANLLRLPHTHISPESEPPTGEGATTRPRDCQLYTKETEDLGVEGGLSCSLFGEWWAEYLSKK